MKWVFPVVLLELSVALSLAAPASNQKSSPGSSTSTWAKTTRHTKRRIAHTPKPSYQLHPDPERYQEIQKALAEKGYFKGEVNGQWGSDSIDALQRFQADQKLPNDGKIGALTLTGLGLGPKHDGSSVTPVGAPAAAPAPLVQPPPPSSASAPSPRPPGLL